MAAVLGFLPPSHKFFFSREIETNLGYVYYRKDGENSSPIGVRQPDKEVGYKPYGISDEVWNRRVGESRGELNNFALYNAPPGTMQRMPVYFYLSPNGSRATQESVMAFTHDDVYKPLPGYKVMVSHFHFHLNEQLTDEHSMDVEPTWLPVFRALGVNLAILADFHSDSHATDTGKVRLDEQSVYFAGCERFSDRDLLLIPGEEPDANFGGHYMFLFPEARLLHARGAAGERPGGSPFRRLYSLMAPSITPATAGNELGLLNQEHGLVWQTHPRTKGSTGYPDVVREKDFFQSDRFLGASFQSLPVDQSEKRLCEARCMGLLDDMNNWAGAKYLLAEGDTYMKYPDDETFPQLVVNYVKLDRVPKFKDGWTPVVDALRAGKFLRYQRRGADSRLERGRRRREAHLHRGSGMDLPAGIRRTGVERREDRGTPDDRHGGNGALRQSQIPHSVRCRGQEVGSFCRLGFGRQWRIHPARPPQMTSAPLRVPKIL